MLAKLYKLVQNCWTYFADGMQALAWSSSATHIQLYKVPPLQINRGHSAFMEIYELENSARGNGDSIWKIIKTNFKYIDKSFALIAFGGRNKPIRLLWCHLCCGIASWKKLYKLLLFSHFLKYIKLCVFFQMTLYDYYPPHPEFIWLWMAFGTFFIEKAVYEMHNILHGSWGAFKLIRNNYQWHHWLIVS